MPHFVQVGICWQRTSLRLFDGPVLSRAPRAAVFIAGRPELPPWSAALDHFALARQKRMDKQASAAIFKRKALSGRIRCAAMTCILTLTLGFNTGLVHSV